jgi:two-component system NtrC family sensor kinase
MADGPNSTRPRFTQRKNSGHPAAGTRVLQSAAATKCPFAFKQLVAVPRNRLLACGLLVNAEDHRAQKGAFIGRRAWSGMLYSTRSKLIASFLGVSLLVGAASLFIGIRLVDTHVFGEALNRVRQDLNAANEMYATRVKHVKTSLSITALGFAFISSVRDQNTTDLALRLERMAKLADLDFAGIVAADRSTLCRTGPNAFPQPGHRLDNPLVATVLEQRISVSGTEVLSADFLVQENHELAERARIPLAAGPPGASGARDEVSAGMTIAAAVPVFDGNVFLGALYGGMLLNRSEAFVDTVRDTVFQGESFNGRGIGTATIFLNDVRIATNVLTPEGRRALGTRVSPEVKEHVLGKGKLWTDRAFVFSDWFITAYSPIETLSGRRAGMLYVGVLEEKYTDIRRQLLTVYVLLTLAVMLAAAGLGYFIASRITSPIQGLIKASRQVSEGNLTPDIGPSEKGEIGLLQNTFREMVAAMGRRHADSEARIIQTQKQASVGRLAAGVAHEINNPLTGVLTYTHLLLRRKDLAADMRADLQVIAEATERVRKIVKGLLDFSRQTKLDPEPTDINRLAATTIALIENQALMKGVAIKFNPGEALPELTVDRSQIQSVLINIIINALDATEPGGTIRVFSSASLTGQPTGRKGVEITIADTGAGIPPENLDKLFEPFFTTKPVGQGTGLGLAVSLGIVQGHGGHIRVQSEVGKGSRFFIWLPAEKRNGIESAGG